MYGKLIASIISRTCNSMPSNIAMAFSALLVCGGWWKTGFTHSLPVSSLVPSNKILFMVISTCHSGL